MRSGMRGIRITGGEPMLHPHIHRFLRLAVQARLPVHLFSNLTLPGCIQGIEVPAMAISFLANINDRETYHSGDWDALTENLRQASARRYQTVLAYTVHSGTFDLEHLKDLAVTYEIAKVRISPSMPMIGAGNLWLRPEEIPQFAESAFTLHRELAALGKRLVLDCPIPLCHIPRKYLPFFLTDLKLTGHCCFGISVDVNLEVGHCYIPNKLLKRRSLRSFGNMSEMLDYRDSCVGELDDCCPPFPGCPDCDYGTQGICTAGCYGIRHYMAHQGEGNKV